MRDIMSLPCIYLSFGFGFGFAFAMEFEFIIFVYYKVMNYEIADPNSSKKKNI